MHQCYPGFGETDYPTRYLCGGNFYELDVVEIDGRNEDYSGLIEMHQDFAFVLVYDAASLPSFEDVKLKFEKICAQFFHLDSKCVSLVPVIIVEYAGRVEHPAMHSSEYLRPVAKGHGRSFAEFKGCGFVSFSALIHSQIKNVFAVLVEEVHRVPSHDGVNYRTSSVWVTKVKLFHAGLESLIGSD